MYKIISTIILTITILFFQTGCIPKSTSGPSEATSSAKQTIEINSETEEKIFKQAVVTGTIAGGVVTAILVNKFGSGMPFLLKGAVIAGGAVAAKKLAEYIAMEQIATLRGVTLNTEEMEALLKEARKQNAIVAQNNDDLRQKIEEIKSNTADKKKRQDEAKAALEIAKANQANIHDVLKKRKGMLEVLDKKNSQHEDLQKEILVLEEYVKVLDTTVAEIEKETGDEGLIG